MNLFLELAKKAGLDGKYEVGSAGTDDYHVGQPPDARMLRVAARHGLHYDGRARQFLRSDFNQYDLILAMDMENRDELMYLALYPEQREKVHLLREFDPQGDANASVPDPWYGGAEGFDEVYRVVERSVRGLLEKLELEE
jgi:protein-tyrosine phosphatase